MFSTDYISFIDQFALFAYLIFKHYQNMIDGLVAFKHLIVVQPIIECMNHSTLKRALNHHENVPFSSLLLAYTTASYNKKMDVMTLRFNGATLQLISMLFARC